MFIGREQELKDLDAFWGRDQGVLITCRGRRRIGKSTLIAKQLYSQRNILMLSCCVLEFHGIESDSPTVLLYRSLPFCINLPPGSPHPQTVGHPPCLVSLWLLLFLSLMIFLLFPPSPLYSHG